MEPLSGAASIITVASLAIQLCDSMKKVYGFWQSIKDGPDEIAHITAEISIFMKWLTIIANRYQRQFDGVHKESEAAAIDALELCQQVVERMRKITNNTENDLAGKKHQRPWTLIKAAFRKERIERMLQDTERMKSLMILVQTCCIGDLQEAQSNHLALVLRQKASELPLSRQDSVDISDLNGTELCLKESVKSSPRTNPKWLDRVQRTSESWLNFGLAVLNYRITDLENSCFDDTVSDEKVFKRNEQRIDFHLRWAQWLLRRGHRLQCTGIYGDWQYSFRTFRYIPKDALIVDFCMAGDVLNVQKLFAKRLASPHDRVELEDEDWSLLHIAAVHCQPHLCKFLIQSGLGNGAVSGISRYPILRYVGRPPTESPDIEVDTLRVLIHDGRYDPMELGHNLTVIDSYPGSLAAYEWLLDQDDFCIYHESSVILGQLTMLSRKAMSEHSHESERTAAVLKRVIALQDLCSEHWPSLISRVYSFILLPTFNELGIPELTNCVRALWEASANLLDPQDQGSTIDEILLSLINWSMFMWKHHWRERFNFHPSKLSEEFVVERRKNQSPNEIISDLKNYPRFPRLLWKTWYPSNDLSALEVMQRCVDAQLEVLWEAGIDLETYGKNQALQHPRGFNFYKYDYWANATFVFEFGEHVHGCRIHIVEIGLRMADYESVYGFAGKMPGSWNSEDKFKVEDRCDFDNGWNFGDETDSRQETDSEDKIQSKNELDSTTDRRSEYDSL